MLYVCTMLSRTQFAVGKFNQITLDGCVHLIFCLRLSERRVQVHSVVRSREKERERILCSAKMRGREIIIKNE